MVLWDAYFEETLACTYASGDLHACIVLRQMPDISCAGCAARRRTP